MTVLTEKKTQPKKLQVMFYLGTLLRTITQSTASHKTLRNSSKEVKELRYIGAIAEKNTYSTSKDTADHKQKPDISSHDFSTFLRMGKCKSLASLK